MQAHNFEFTLNCDIIQFLTQYFQNTGVYTIHWSVPLPECTL